MKYKMFVSDFDWTLGKGPNYIDTETVELIKKYQKKGGIFVICTGRAKSAILSITDYHKIDCDLICCQGAIISHSKTGKTLESYGIDPNLSQRIANDLVLDNETVLLHYDDLLAYNRKDKFVEHYEMLTSLNGHEIKDVCSFIEKEQPTIQKLMALAMPDRVNAIIEKYQAKYPEVLINSGARGLVEIINPKYSKGLATKKLADKYNVDYKDVLVIGDSTNDVAMFEKEFYKVAVGSACEELKSLSDEVAVDFEKNPVKQMLLKYCL